MVRELAADSGCACRILLDLQGPKIRLGTFENGGCMLEPVAIQDHDRSGHGTCERASTTYKDFVKDVKPGDQVLLADGSVELRVLDKTATDAICEVVSGGKISIARASTYRASMSAQLP